MGFSEEGTFELRTLSPVKLREQSGGGENDGPSTGRSCWSLITLGHGKRGSRGVTCVKEPSPADGREWIVRGQSERCCGSSDQDGVRGGGEKWTFWIHLALLALIGNHGG